MMSLALLIVVICCACGVAQANMDMDYSNPLHEETQQDMETESTNVLKPFDEGAHPPYMLVCILLLTYLLTS